MKKRGCFLLIALGITALCWWQIQPQKYFPWFVKKSTFFATAPIRHFSESGIPLIPIHMENQNFCAKLDLGFQGDMSLPIDVLNHIQNKIPKGSAVYYGVQGKSYSQTTYQSPNIEIGKMLFSNATLSEESKEFFQDSVVVGKTSNSEPTSRLGWELFYNTNLFLDFKHSMIAFCDSIDTLKEKMQITDHFIKLPFHLERGILEIDVQTDQGPLRCFLDTGTSWNILNTHNQELIYSNIKINNQDFGCHIFHSVPLKFPFKIDAILGAEFFQQCRAFIDFQKRQIYLSKIE